MAQTSCVILSFDDRERLAAIIADRNRPLKHVQRARIILHSDERLSVLEVARRAGVSRPAVWRWQQRYAEDGVDGLLRDKTRPPGKPPLPARTVHKHGSVRAWLARHPRWVFHFTPTSASWPNAVETFFSALTRRRLRRGDFASITDLQAAIHRYIAQHNGSPRPFIWTKSAEAILHKLNQQPAPSK